MRLFAYFEEVGLCVVLPAPPISAMISRSIRWAGLPMSSLRSMRWPGRPAIEPALPLLIFAAMFSYLCFLYKKLRKSVKCCSFKLSECNCRCGMSILVGMGSSSLLYPVFESRLLPLRWLPYALILMLRSGCPVDVCRFTIDLATLLYTDADFLERSDLLSSSSAMMDSLSSASSCGIIDILRMKLETLLFVPCGLNFVNVPVLVSRYLTLFQPLLVFDFYDLVSNVACGPVMSNWPMFRIGCGSKSIASFMQLSFLKDF